MDVRLTENCSDGRSVAGPARRRCRPQSSRPVDVVLAAFALLVLTVGDEAAHRDGPRSAVEGDRVSVPSTRPGTRAVTSWSDQLVASGSRNVADRLVASYFGASAEDAAVHIVANCAPGVPAWKTSLTSTPTSASSLAPA